MAKQAAVNFDRELRDLFADRTFWLRSQVRKPRPGMPPAFNRKKVEKGIRKLQKLATTCLLHSHAIDGLNRLYDLKRQWHVNPNKGWRIDNKKKTFVVWFKKNIRYKNCVYAFWDERRCLYIGRTLKGKSRPQSHFEKKWFSKCTRIDIYALRGSKNTPKLECLATHRFEPLHSKIKPASRRWGAKCPICETHKSIRDEVKSIFRL